jgi:uncharacterized damage-inducible protein DinB
MTGADLIPLFQYDEWATKQLLEAAAPLDANAFQKDLGTSFRGVQGTLVHIFGAQQIWLSRWKGGKPTALISPEEIPTLDELKHRWHDLYVEMRDTIAPLTNEQLHNPSSYQDLKGNRWSEPLYQQIQHVLFHSMYHRGQVVTLLRQLGQAPPHTDLILYYRTR